MNVRKGCWIPLLMLVLAGCGGKPFDYHPQTEIPEGPGMFSGEEGAFILYSSDKKKKARTESAAGSPEEFREFREYQEFRRWKESAKDTPEYREFQEWREWKADKKWKGGQPK